MNTNQSHCIIIFRPIRPRVRFDIVLFYKCLIRKKVKLCVFNLLFRVSSTVNVFGKTIVNPLTMTNDKNTEIPSIILKSPRGCHCHSPRNRPLSKRRFLYFHILIFIHNTIYMWWLIPRREQYRVESNKTWLIWITGEFQKL